LAYLLDVDASAEDVGSNEDLLQALPVPVQHLKKHLNASLRIFLYSKNQTTKPVRSLKDPAPDYFCFFQAKQNEREGGGGGITIELNLNNQTYRFFYRY
jgi:hypothetical protein